MVVTSKVVVCRGIHSLLSAVHGRADQGVGDGESEKAKDESSPKKQNQVSADNILHPLDLMCGHPSSDNANACEEMVEAFIPEWPA
jgi:hypothetical protein